MHKIDEPTFRKILEAALACGDIKHPSLLELVATYLVTGAAVTIAPDYLPDLSATEENVDDVLFSLDMQTNYEWAELAYEILLKRYPLPQTNTHETTDNCQS